MNGVNAPPPALVLVEQTVAASILSMCLPHTPPCTCGGVRGEERRAPQAEVRVVDCSYYVHTADS